jgi:predicted CopG family antitoxin
VHRKLTITVTDEVYQGLLHTVGRGQISGFIDRIVRPYVVDDLALEQDYRAMLEDEEREREALEWIEAAPDEGLDDSR